MINFDFYEFYSKFAIDLCSIYIIITSTKEGHLFDAIVDAHLTTCFLCAYLKTVS